MSYAEYNCALCVYVACSLVIVSEPLDSFLAFYWMLDRCMSKCIRYRKAENKFILY